MDKLEQIKMFITRMGENSSQDDEMVIIGWAKVNNRGDIFDLRTHYNPYESLPTITIYASRKEIEEAVKK